jgi:hypothetical protein
MIHDFAQPTVVNIARFLASAGVDKLEIRDKCGIDGILTANIRRPHDAGDANRLLFTRDVESF